MVHRDKQMNPSQFLYRFKYRYAPKLNLTVPVDVSLELASLCNQRCSYCYHADQTNLPFVKGIMPFEVAKKILFQSADAGVNSVKFNWKGESTINPNFLNITRIAKALASGSTFLDRLTNSNFKFATDRDDIFEGLCQQTKVKVSFDSFRKDVMETQRAGSIHELALRNIEKFYNYSSRKKTEIIIQAVRTKLNHDEDIAGEVKRRWPEATVSIRDMVAGRVDKDLSDLESRKRDISQRQSCIQAHARLIFNWNGKAFVCCPDVAEKLCVGDIYQSNVIDIFNSKEAKAIRKSLKDKTAFTNDPCRSCPSFETYKGFKPKWGS